MTLLVCIDDTDNLDSRGTGELAELIAEGIERSGWGHCSVITRHQLLLHDDIPYTSHNSSMCFCASLNAPESLIQVIKYAEEFLRIESAEGSDPGLAVMDMDALTEPSEIINFGQRAKCEVLTKTQAYSFAQKHTIHLSEHGGTGQGVIGALAGIGLRLSGNDGRVRGKLKVGDAGTEISVEALLRYPQIDAVQAIDKVPLDAADKILLGDKVKTVWLNHQAVLLVSPGEGGIWETCGKQQLRNY
jgi:hypothetical protein